MLKNKKIDLSNTENKQRYVAALFEEYYQDLLRFVKSRCKNTDYSSDIVQETFIQVYKNITQLNSHDPRTVRSWLYTIARRTTINYCTRNHLDDADLKDSFTDAELKKCAENVWVVSVEDDVIKKEMIRYIYSIMENLPSKDRDMILLKNKGFKCKEIAAILDMEPKTVKARTRNLENKLRKIAKERGEYINETN